MSAIIYGIGTALFVVLALLHSRCAATGMASRAPPARGKKNTVLFLVTGEHGYSNVHAATSYALLEKHGLVDVHFASFSNFETKVDRVSSFVRRNNPSSQPIIFHSLPGPNYMESVGLDPWNFDQYDSLIAPPGWAGSWQLARDLQMYLSPWTGPAHYALYQAITTLIADIDPAVIVLDVFFRPGIHAARARNRRHVVLTPISATDVINATRPWTAMLKYPALASGIRYPLPWTQLPLNIALTLRLVATMAFSPLLCVTNSYLRARGIHDFLGAYPPDAPIIAQTVPEAAFPYGTLPSNMSVVPPMVISVASVEVQDAKLGAWLARKPTVLVNLGSTVQYTIERAKIMAYALAQVLEVVDVQVLWKVRKADDFGDDVFLGPLERFTNSGQVRVESWLVVDPPAILETGNIVASVHHGGANCFYEAVMAGVPHVILPMWLDHYNFANLAEYLDIGIWASKKTAPGWNVEEIVNGLLKVLNGGSASVSMAEMAKVIAAQAQSRGEGRDQAAREIARLAALGE